MKNIEKEINTISVIIDSLGLNPHNEKVIIPHSNFIQKGVPVIEAIAIIKRIENEKEGIIKTIEHGRPLLPNKNLVPHSFIGGYEEDMDNYQRDLEKYERIHKDSIEVVVADVKNLKKLLDNLIERQNYLVCKDIKFNIKTGYTVYGKTKVIFKPCDIHYKLFKALLEKPNEIINYDEINKLLDRKNKSSKNDREYISTIIKNIKTKLNIIGKNENKNKDIFKAANGYMIKCG